jgi:hypothetical protein
MEWNSRNVLSLRRLKYVAARAREKQARGAEKVKEEDDVEFSFLLLPFSPPPRSCLAKNPQMIAIPLTESLCS